ELLRVGPEGGTAAGAEGKRVARPERDVLPGVGEERHEPDVRPGRAGDRGGPAAARGGEEKARHGVVRREGEAGVDERPGVRLGAEVGEVGERDAEDGERAVEAAELVERVAGAGHEAVVAVAEDGAAPVVGQLAEDGRAAWR